MRIWAALALTLLAALPLRAETVRVRSGEHPDFSRLVFTFDAPTSWSLERRGDGYDLVLNRPDVRIDLSQVFRFIPRTRLRDISFDASGLRGRLTVTCPCHAEAFEIGPGKLVIDIKDGLNPDENRREASKPAPDAIETRPLPENLMRPPLRVIGDFTGPAPAPVPPATPPIKERQADAARVAALQEVLLKELSRASAQGLVKPDIAPLPISTNAAPPVLKMRPAPPDSVPPPGSPGLTVETSVDRARSAIFAAASTDQGTACQPAHHFDVVGWGRDEHPAVLIAEARNGIVGEFDKVDPKVLRRLVTTYLYLGFGAEAQAAMRGFGVEPADAGFLSVLAQIMDDGHVDTGLLPQDQLGCDAPVALWAALARSTLPRGVEINQTAILRAFSTLPIHLRRHLGPGLAGRFLTIDDHETATGIRNAIARAPGDHGSGVALMEAQIELAHGIRPEAALKDIVARDDPASVEALLLLTEARLADGLAPASSDVIAAAALAFEHRETAFGARLERVSVLGDARNGAFETGFAKLGRLDETQSAPLRAEFLEIFNASATDADFLRHAYALLPADTRPEMGDAVAISIAQRFLALGFPQEAQAMLPPHGGAESDNLRLLRARLAHIQGNAAEQLRNLAGLAGTEAEQMRGDAYAALGNSEAAADHYMTAGAAAQLADLAWQSGDWARVADLGSAEQQRFAAAYLRRAEDADVDAAQGEPSLAYTQVLLQRSAAARDILQGLLADPAAP
ncbi:hypothetical protein [Actibacterium sp. D379-3]